MSKACLSLVHRLLSYELNKHAEAFNRVFSRQQIQLIKSMRLDLHMRERGIIVNNQKVMLVLNAYLKINPRCDIRLLMNDQEACT